MRDDLSNKLVHLAKGASNDLSKHRSEAFETLCNILLEKQIRGGTGFIKGSHKCVCFSEAPIGKLSHLLAEQDHGKFKYQPYGILVDKVWIYELGGRPVIYGPEEDYLKLPEEMQYRHVRFHLSKKYAVDHTWEREWRYETDALVIRPEYVTVVVADRNAKNILVESFGEDNWHYISLSDLGVTIASL